jgi:hypothetical protein
MRGLPNKDWQRNRIGAFSVTFRIEQCALRICITANSQIRPKHRLTPRLALPAEFWGTNRSSRKMPLPELEAARLED